MIHVCSLARLHATVAATGAQHVVSLVKHIDIVAPALNIPPANHLHVGIDDVSAAAEGYILPAAEHVATLVAFSRQWQGTSPLVVHCNAGISRSTAAAFILACALRPERDEASIADAIRASSPTANPNRLLVSLADIHLARQGRMIAALDRIGSGVPAAEGIPFRLDLS